VPTRISVLSTVAAVAVLLLSAGAGGQGGAPQVVFDSPLDGGYASGPIPLKIHLDPAGVAVNSVSFSADGRMVCTLEQPPFECPWDAGPQVHEHTIRASVVLADGRRISRALRTKGVEYVETVDVDVVQVTATVTDGNGRFVRGLTRDLFHVYEDDVPQRISAFASENIPLEIVVAMDVSGSMAPSMPAVKEAVKKFLTALRPTDRVTLIGFNDNVFTLARPTADLATRLKAVDRMSAWGGTALYDVTVKAIDQLGRQTGRRALVLFTDGEDLNSRIPEEAAERRVEASDVLVYPIGQGRALKTESLRRVLARLADKSGGRAFFDNVSGLDEVFGKIVDELSNQYLLGYPRPDTVRDSRWRKLRVDVPGRRDLKVRARQGYRVTQR
jgi:Ca-activated chloride channel homolog